MGLDLRGDASAWPDPYKTLDQTLPGDLPDTVLAAIRVDFRRLTPPAQRALSAAAVAGRSGLTSGCWPGSWARQLEEVAKALDELEWHRWLVYDPRGYTFVARIVRQVIAQDMLTPGQRQRVLEAAGLSQPDLVHKEGVITAPSSPLRSGR